MEGLLTALQILTSLAVISLCVVVVDSVAKLRRFARKLGKTSTEAVENIAELTRMAREKELPHRADEALAEARRVMGELTRRARESLANLDRLLADEAVKSAPGQIVDLVARGNDLVTQAQQAVDRLNAVLKAPADTAAMVTQSVRPMVEDAREKVDLLRSLFTALAAGVSAGWDDLRSGAEDTGEPGEEA
jgi:chemotaxis regulatin CheY-phosphate phosphatase CheZ